MKKYAAWKVAAAILILEGKPLKYSYLTDRVLSSSLSRLGAKGGKTPRNTLNRIMNQTHDDKFINYGNGKFWVKKSLTQNKEINQIIDEIENGLEERSLDGDGGVEGEKKWKYATYYERNPKLREEAVNFHGTTCMVKSCGFNFEEVYGTHGKDFIEVHHLEPLGNYQGIRKVNPKKDMVVVCSNCHRMIHRKSSKLLDLNDVNDIILKRS